MGRIITKGLRSTSSLTALRSQDDCDLGVKGVKKTAKDVVGDEYHNYRRQLQTRRPQPNVPEREAF